MKINKFAIILLSSLITYNLKTANIQEYSDKQFLAMEELAEIEILSNLIVEITKEVVIDLMKVNTDTERQVVKKYILISGKECPRIRITNTICTKDLEFIAEIVANTKKNIEYYICKLDKDGIKRNQICDYATWSKFASEKFILLVAY